MAAATSGEAGASGPHTAPLFCEYAYLVDLDANKLEVYQGFNKSPLPNDARFAFLEEKAEGGYHPIRLLKSYSFDELAPDTMTKLESSIAAED